jgi:2-methylcitrate dehydratase PrpD
MTQKPHSRALDRPRTAGPWTTPIARRDLFRAAAATVGAALVSPMRALAQAPGPVMTALSAYMSDAATRALPTDAVEHAKRHILDTLAAMISGSELVPGQAALRFAEAQGGGGRATVVGSNLVAGPIQAALANGVSAHADETDDSHNPSRSHPGAAVVPAALAVSEEFDVDGRRFLRAVALGYDVGPRVAMSMGSVEFRNSGHISSHGIAGVFGAAAAAASAATLTPQQMRWVLDYTAQQSSGITAWGRDVDHIEKAFVFGGMPARSGVTSALLVQLGWNGIDDIFSGAHNFFDAYAPDPKPEVLIDGLGSRYEVTRTDIKKWSVGTPIQAPLDCLELARGKHPFEAEDVQEVVVRLAPIVALVVDNRDIPDICLQHMVAVMLIDKTASFRAAHDKARMEDAEILRQRAKVRLVPDSALDRFLPVRVAAIEVTLTDGTRLTEQVEAVRGTPRNPMSREEVVDKATDLIAPVLGDDKTSRLVETIFDIERLDSVRTLQPLLQLG